VRVGLEVTGRGIVREHQDLYVNDRKVGVTTSGTHCPYLGKPVAMALVERTYASEGTELQADVRGRRVEVKTIPLPFYKRA
jgi:aminomethyltransferase